MVLVFRCIILGNACTTQSTPLLNILLLYGYYYIIIEHYFEMGKGNVEVRHAW